MELDFWNNPQLHSDAEQLKRQKSALNKKLTPISVDEENLSCGIKGSGKEPYYVTLEQCSCSDFVRRKLPCKHMYRLAHILDVHPLSGNVAVSDVIALRANGDKTDFLDKTTGEIITSLSPADILQIIDQLPTTALKTLYNLAHTLHFRPDYKEFIFDEKDVSTLIRAKLLQPVDMSIEEKLSYASRDQILDLLDILEPDEPKKYNPKSISRTLVRYLLNSYLSELDSLPIYIVERNPCVLNYLNLYRAVADKLGIELNQQSDDYFYY